MTRRQIFRRFTETEQRDYERLARLEYGPDLVNESTQRWNNYTDAQKEAIMAEAEAIYMDMVKAIESEIPHDAPEIQDILDRWQENLRHFYEPTLDILRGLGETYAVHPEFRANFEALHVDLPDYLQTAIVHYVDELETEVIEEMLAEDEARLRRLGL